MINLFRKKNSNKQSSEPKLSKLQEDSITFHKIRLWIEEVVDKTTLTGDKIAILDLFQDILRHQLYYELQGWIFSQEFQNKNHPRSLFPQLFEPTSNGTTTINLKYDVVVSIPWKPVKWVDNAIFRKSSTRGLRIPHNIYWYEPFKIGFVDNDIHRMIQLNDGNDHLMEAQLKDCSHFFDILSTDGEYWFEKETNKQLEPVIDYRMALLFLSEQIRLEVIKNEPSN